MEVNEAAVQIVASIAIAFSVFCLFAWLGWMGWLDLPRNHQSAKEEDDQ